MKVMASASLTWLLCAVFVAGSQPWTAYPGVACRDADEVVLRENANAENCEQLCADEPCCAFYSYSEADSGAECWTHEGYASDNGAWQDCASNQEGWTTKIRPGTEGMDEQSESSEEHRHHHDSPEEPGEEVCTRTPNPDPLTPSNPSTTPPPSDDPPSECTAVSVTDREACADLSVDACNSDARCHPVSPWGPTLRPTAAPAEPPATAAAAENSPAPEPAETPAPSVDAPAPTEAVPTTPEPETAAPTTTTAPTDDPTPDPDPAGAPTPEEAAPAATGAPTMAATRIPTVAPSLPTAPAATTSPADATPEPSPPDEDTQTEFVGCCTHGRAEFGMLARACRVLETDYVCRAKDPEHGAACDQLQETDCGTQSALCEWVGFSGSCPIFEGLCKESGFPVGLGCPYGAGTAVAATADPTDAPEQAAAVAEPGANDFWSGSLDWMQTHQNEMAAIGALLVLCVCCTFFITKRCQLKDSNYDRLDLGANAAPEDLELTHMQTPEIGRRGRDRDRRETISDLL